MTIVLKDQLAAEGQEKEALLSKYNQSVDELKVARQKLEEAEKSRSEMQERLKSLTDELARTTEKCERFAEKSSSVLVCRPPKSRIQLQQHIFVNYHGDVTSCFSLAGVRHYRWQCWLSPL